MIQSLESDEMTALGRNDIGGRRPLLEDNLRWKTTFSGRHPSVEDDFRWKTTFGWKMTFGWMTTFGGRRPTVEDDFWWKTILACCLVRFVAFFVAQKAGAPKNGIERFCSTPKK